MSDEPDDVMRGHVPDGSPGEPGPQPGVSQGRYVPPPFVWEQLPPDAQAQRLAAQRRNARVVALVLGVLVALIFALAIAKIGGQHK
ncbi:MAG: hypothetical protein J0I47_12115 [Sphingomonas sp.]|uniref:hypothetical protein n=1 Tax=Sphingomonas sp. TaxID=28214 RepID=UPI001AC6B975|nr:hypothetical protein [Sphingomonas sp.]MBN8808960.1 hypothetical protein [Sphingomonas sp.]